MTGLAFPEITQWVTCYHDIYAVCHPERSRRVSPHKADDREVLGYLDVPRSCDIVCVSALAIDMVVVAEGSGPRRDRLFFGG